MLIVLDAFSAPYLINFCFAKGPPAPVISVIDDSSNPNEVEILWTDECAKKDSDCDKKITTSFYTVANKATNSDVEPSLEEVDPKDEQNEMRHTIYGLTANTHYDITVKITSQGTNNVKIYSDTSSVNTITGK